uniref:Uncharacterized protein n=1 Tax=Cannabis sativa TaxID=3483 RepID=A0A803PQL7_CANSA
MGPLRSTNQEWGISRDWAKVGRISQYLAFSYICKVQDWRPRSLVLLPGGGLNTHRHWWRTESFLRPVYCRLLIDFCFVFSSKSLFSVSGQSKHPQMALSSHDVTPLAPLKEVCYAGPELDPWPIHATAAILRKYHRPGRNMANQIPNKLVYHG